MRNGLFHFLGQVDEVDLGPAASRTGNEGRPETAQAKGTEDGLAGLDFFDGIARQGYADRIADAFVEQRTDTDGRLDAPFTDQAGFRLRPSAGHKAPYRPGLHRLRSSRARRRT
jgi:hypothetical protein